MGGAPTHTLIPHGPTLAYPGAQVRLGRSASSPRAQPEPVWPGSDPLSWKLGLPLKRPRAPLSPEPNALDIR